ncbi:MAG: DUF554 domain-containing protein [Anaerolineales bacterium]|nr:DUF554 domain-containing protein [Anaerolineales bacterium]
MTGTILNVIAIFIGGILGIFLGGKIPDRVRTTVVSGLGLFTLVLGVRLFLQSENPLIPLGAILIGGIIGEWLDIEGGLKRLGLWLEARFNSDKSSSKQEKFVRGFLTASLLFEIGPLAILGSIQDGLTGDFSLLATKSVMDGFASLALASTLGIGVLFSTVIVLVYQGGISLLAIQAQSLLTETMIAEMTAVGGVVLLGLAISSLLEIKRIRTGNLLPALLFAPILVWILSFI